MTLHLRAVRKDNSILVTYLLVQAASILGLFIITTFISSSHVLTIPPSLAGLAVLMLTAIAFASRFQLNLSVDGFVPIASHRHVAMPAWIGRLLLAEQQV